jgi:hypothetical protein
MPGRVHRVIYEDMVADTETQVRALLDYCGLDVRRALPALLRERPGGAHRQFRAGAPADLPRRRGPVAAFRALARTAGRTRSVRPCSITRHRRRAFHNHKADHRHSQPPTRGTRHARKHAQQPQDRSAHTAPSPAACSGGGDGDVRAAGLGAGCRAGWREEGRAHPRHHHGDRAEARGEPAEGADQPAGAGQPPSSSSRTSPTSTTTPS